MEWVETTAKSLEEAKEIALERLGIGPDDAEFEILEEPKAGLFGRVRGEARVRARVLPVTPRPKVERRDRKRKPKSGNEGGSEKTEPRSATEPAKKGSSGARNGSERAPSGAR